MAEKRFYAKKTDFDNELDLNAFSANPESYYHNILNNFLNELYAGRNLKDLLNYLTMLIVIISYTNSVHLNMDQETLDAVQDDIVKVLAEEVRENRDLGIAIVEGIDFYEKEFGQPKLPPNLIELRSGLIFLLAQ